MRKNNISIIKEKNCVGCACCIDICPKNIIISIKDKYGFLHSCLERNDTCINCGKCLSVCSAYENNINNFSDRCKNGYVAINTDEYERVTSSSGGIFPLLAQCILNDNGVVYGAVFDSDFTVIHIRGESLCDIQRMKGSKYVQSNICGIYKSIEDDLEQNKKVLFSGLPCQCYALKKYITLCKADKQDNLFLCDLICHGIVSPKIWKEYIKWRSREKEIDTINFRDKRYGSNYYALSITYKDKSNICEKDIRDPYIDIFQNDYAVRSCCTECRFKTKNRFSDITIGDYAGSMTGLDKRMDDGKGKSLVITNTQKGNELFEAIHKKILYNSINISKYTQNNIDSSKTIKSNGSFWTDYFDKGFSYILEKYTEENYYIHKKRQIKRFLKKIYMKVLK